MYIRSNYLISFGCFLKNFMFFILILLGISEVGALEKGDKIERDLKQSGRFVMVLRNDNLNQGGLYFHTASNSQQMLHLMTTKDVLLHRSFMFSRAQSHYLSGRIYPEKPFIYGVEINIGDSRLHFRVVGTSHGTGMHHVLPKEEYGCLINQTSVCALEMAKDSLCVSEKLDRFYRGIEKNLKKGKLLLTKEADLKGKQEEVDKKAKSNLSSYRGELKAFLKHLLAREGLENHFAKWGDLVDQIHPSITLMLANHLTEYMNQKHEFGMDNAIEADFKRENPGFVVHSLETLSDRYSVKYLKSLTAHPVETVEGIQQALMDACTERANILDVSYLSGGMEYPSDMHDVYLRDVIWSPRIMRTILDPKSYKVGKNPLFAVGQMHLYNFHILLAKNVQKLFPNVPFSMTLKRLVRKTSGYQWITVNSGFDVSEPFSYVTEVGKEQ